MLLSSSGIPGHPWSQAVVLSRVDAVLRPPFGHERPTHQLLGTRPSTQVGIKKTCSTQSQATFRGQANIRVESPEPSPHLRITLRDHLSSSARQVDEAS
jgi:hypothetical protein